MSPPTVPTMSPPRIPNTTTANEDDSMIPNLDEIIEAAVKKSREANNPTLGLALDQIYHDALSDKTLMNLLGAILARTADPTQTEQFRAHVSDAKKQLKHGSASTRRPSETTPNTTTPDEDDSMIPNLGEIIEAMVKRSREVGNPTFGLVLRQIHYHALCNETLMDLLGAVLAQKAEPTQIKQFRAYVNRAKKQLKHDSASARRLSATAGGNGVAATGDGTAPVEEGNVLAGDAVAPAEDGTALPILPRTCAGKKAWGRYGKSEMASRLTNTSKGGSIDSKKDKETAGRAAVKFEMDNTDAYKPRKGREGKDPGWR